MRCEAVDMTAAPAQLAFGYAAIFRREIEQRASGVLRDDRFVDVQFEALVRDPVGTVERVYERLDRPFDETVRARVRDYAAHKPKDSRGPHRYSVAEIGLDAATERERFRFYTDRYGIDVEAQ
jgi:hypothetical protein